MSDNLIPRIRELCKARKAVILVHNYQRGEVQDIGDYVGDSLGLSRTAATTDAEVVVFCGVYFMAETAAILCPGKKVLMPDEHAGCPMADMITPRELTNFRADHPNAVVVTYVNSSAAIKAMSDICCTSANAGAVVAGYPKDQEILFVPDRNLGSYVARKVKRDLILWNGYCPTHQRILTEHAEATRLEHPEAQLVVHPECQPMVVEMADAVASTSGILHFCRESNAKEFIIGTELGILHRLRKENPLKRFYPVSPLADCPNMKLTTLEKILWCLEDMAPEVTVSTETAEKARAPINRMLEVVGEIGHDG